MCAADGKQDKCVKEPSAAPASTSRVKTETDRSIEEMIQPKKTAAPTKAGKSLDSSIRSEVLKLRVYNVDG